MYDDATGLPTTMLGLDGFEVLGAGEYGGELELLVQTTEALVGCPDCGVVATAHGRREHLVRDVSAGGRPVLLVWRKRLWRCAETACPRRTWTETHPDVAARAALTQRARRWGCREVGQYGRTVAAIAVLLGVGWNTVLRAVRAFGQPLVDDPDRLDDVTALGVDEHVWQHAGRDRRIAFGTGIVDLFPVAGGRSARLLDVIPGRTGTVDAAWIAEREQAWRGRIELAALDPFRGYATALAHQAAAGDPGAGCLPCRETGQPDGRRGAPPGPATHRGSPWAQGWPAVRGPPAESRPPGLYRDEPRGSPCAWCRGAGRRSFGGVVTLTGSFLGMVASIAGAIVASAAVLRGIALLWRRTYGSGRDLQRRLSQLAIGVNDRFVEQLLGVPTFGQSSGDEDSTAIWVTRHCLVAAIFRKRDIYAYSIAVRDPRFHYKLGDASLSQIRGKLGRTRLDQLAKYSPQRVCSVLGASSFRYAEEHYFGRPGGYHYYVLAVGDTGANVVEPPRFQIEPNEVPVDEGGWPDYVQAYRRTALSNSFTVVGGAEALETDSAISMLVARVVLSPHYRRNRGWRPWRRVSRY